MHSPAVMVPIAEQIWKTKYRFHPRSSRPASSVADSGARVEKAAASAETAKSRETWEKRFMDIMSGFAFLPAGRILAGAGTKRSVTLFNCFVMDSIGDDMG